MVGRIFDLLIDDIRSRLQRKGYGLAITPRAKRWLIDKGFDEKYGVRPLRRVLQNEVEHAVAEGILDSLWRSGDILNVSVKHDKLSIEVLSKQKKAVSAAKSTKPKSVNTAKAT
jgi:ATP-dependent Clp protease ATP-binding subunit ClpC